MKYFIHVLVSYKRHKKGLECRHLECSLTIDWEQYAFVGRKLNELEYSFEEGLQFPFNHFWHPEDFCSSLKEERSNLSARSISITTMIMIFTTVCGNMKQSSAFFRLSIGHHKHSLTSLIFFLFFSFFAELPKSSKTLLKCERLLRFS